MNVLQERQVGESAYLSESVAIVLDGNPPERYATSNDLPSQIANRMLHLDWELDRQAWLDGMATGWQERSEEHTTELQSRGHLVCRLLLEYKTTRNLHAAERS